MLTGPAWRKDAIVRLLLGVFLCIYLGSLAASALAFQAGPNRPAARFHLFLGLSVLCLGSALYLLRRPWSVDDFLRRTTPVLVCFYLGLALGAMAQQLAGAVNPSVPQMLIAALSFQGAALLLATFFLREHQVTWSAAFGLRERPKSAVWLGLGTAIAFVPLAWLLQRGSGLLLDQLSFLPFGSEEQQAVRTLRDTTGLAHLSSMGLITVFLAPCGEEFLFRGVIYAGIQQLGCRRAAWWLSSLLFAAVHLNAITFIPLLAFSMVLTWLYERTGNLLAPIAAHSLFNALNFGLLLVSSGL